MKTGISRRAHWLCSGAGAALVTTLALAAPVQAQTATTDAAPEGDVTEVVVTGIRRGIQNAINVKRRSDSIVEAVSAEDIGKLPDQSIAESIARLPGVAAQRSNGRAQALSVRGLGPDYTVTTLNGREQVSTNDNRSVEFDQYPSDLISGVTIYKTPQANMVAQGLAGTADLQTVRPLSFGKRQVALGARFERNSKDALVGGSTNEGQRYTAIYVDQFADKTLGIALGYSYMSSPTQATRWEAWGYPNVNASTLVIGGAKPNVLSSELVRKGFMGVVEYRPNDRLHMIIDGYTSDFDETQYFSGIEFPLFWSSAVLQPGYKTSNGLVTEGTYTNVKAVVNNHVQQRKSKVSAFGWNTEYKLDERWTLSGDLSYSSVQRDDVILETNSGTGPSGQGPYDTIAFKQNDRTGVTFTSAIDYASFDRILLTSPQGWGDGNVTGGQVGYYNKPTVNDELIAVKLSAKRDFDSGPFANAEFGLNRTKRSKEKIVDEYFLGLANGALSLSVPAQYRKGVTDLSFIGIKGMISYDALGLINAGVYRLIPNANGDVTIKDWEVEETVDTAYARLSLNTELFGVPLTGNVGLQVQHADQQSTARSVSSAGANPLSLAANGGTDYTDVLPSVNLIFNLEDDLKIRFAAATTLARPRMGDLTAARTYSYSTTPQYNGYRWTASGGNPNLKPWKADALDLSVEKYFGGKGYVSFAVFYKNLKSYIYDQAVLSDFTGYPTGQTGAPLSTTGFNYTKANGSGGWIKGTEFSVSVPGDLIWAPLDGFGALFSVSTNDSRIQPDGFAQPTDLPGLSKRVVNTTLYYEKYGFSARVSQRYRDDFLGEVPGFGAGLEQIMVKAESIIDAQVGYTFQDGPLSGLSLLLQGNNLTDEPFSTYQNGDKAQVKQYQEYGRTVMFGVSYKF